MKHRTGIDIFWSQYCQYAGVTGPAPGTTCFGDNAQMQTSLCQLVLSGSKRATASLACFYGPGGDPMPMAGELAIVLDGAGDPRGIIEITSVERIAFNAVDARFALLIIGSTNTPPFSAGSSPCKASVFPQPMRSFWSVSD